MLDFIGSYFRGMFFYPDQENYGSPSLHGLSFEDISFKNEKGNTLYGYFLKPKSFPKGTIVHCHGNAHNISEHFVLVSFLVEAGYNVLIFDYAGYGRSEGKPTIEGIVTDARAALAYARTRKDVTANRIGLFGQSLGGAAASGAMAAEKEVRCLILEGTFTTYLEMAWTTSIGRCLFFLTPFVIPNVGPLKSLPDINPRPILILHGDLDELIPVKFANKLFELAGGSKYLSILKGMTHLQGEEGAANYRSLIVDFLKKHLND